MRSQQTVPVSGREPACPTSRRQVGLPTSSCSAEEGATASARPSAVYGPVAVWARGRRVSVGARALALSKLIAADKLAGRPRGRYSQAQRHSAACQRPLPYRRGNQIIQTGSVANDSVRTASNLITPPPRQCRDPVRRDDTRKHISRLRHAAAAADSAGAPARPGRIIREWRCRASHL